MAGFTFARLPSLTASPGSLAGIVTAALGVAAAAEAVINKCRRGSITNATPEATPKVTLETNTTTSRALGTPLRHIPWPKPAAIAFGTHHRIQRDRRLIEWYENGLEVEQDIALRGVKEHSIAVVKYLDARFYLELPRSMRAPCQFDFGVSPRLSESEQALNIITLVDLMKTVRQCLNNYAPRSHQLQLTSTTDDVASTPKKIQLCLLVNQPKLPFYHAKQHLNYLATVARSIVACVYNNSIVDGVHFSFLLQFGKAPDGFEEYLDKDHNGKPIVPLEPHQEPGLFGYQLNKPLRKNAPVFSYWDSKRYIKNAQVKYDRENVQVQYPKNPKVWTLPNYHQHQRIIADAIVKKVARSDSGGVFEDTDMPQASSYMEHWSIYMAIQHEHKARQFQQLNTNAEIYFSDRPRKLEQFKTFAKIAKLYWGEHPDEFERYFPTSKSSSEGRKSPFTPQTELSDSSVKEDKKGEAAGPDDTAIVRVSRNGAVVKSSAIIDEQSHHEHKGQKERKPDSSPLQDIAPNHLSATDKNNQGQDVSVSRPRRSQCAAPNLESTAQVQQQLQSHQLAPDAVKHETVYSQPPSGDQPLHPSPQLPLSTCRKTQYQVHQGSRYQYPPQYYHPMQAASAMQSQYQHLLSQSQQPQISAPPGYQGVPMCQPSQQYQPAVAAGSDAASLLQLFRNQEDRHHVEEQSQARG